MNTLTQEKYQEKYHVSWTTFYRLVDQLADKVRASGYPFDVVVSIGKNGTKIGDYVSAKLGIPHRKVHINRYHNKKPHIQNVNYTTAKCALVVDDIIDSGITMSLFFEYFEPAKSAVLFYNEESRIRPDFYIKFKPDAAVLFPWEKNEPSRGKNVPSRDEVYRILKNRSEELKMGINND